MFRGFVAYTHFLISPFTVQFAVFVLSMLAKAGWKHAKSLGARVREFFDVVQQRDDMHFA